MAKAIWKNAIIAESGDYEKVEGNVYFPPEAIKKEYFLPSQTHTTCPWKGQASYFDIVVNGNINKDAAWYYPNPNPAAKNIKGCVAFWKGVLVEEESTSQDQEDISCACEPETS